MQPHSSSNGVDRSTLDFIILTLIFLWIVFLDVSLCCFQFSALTFIVTFFKITPRENLD